MMGLVAMMLLNYLYSVDASENDRNRTTASVSTTWQEALVSDLRLRQASFLTVHSRSGPGLLSLLRT
jgi:hypothetical protein